MSNDLQTGADVHLTCLTRLIEDAQKGDKAAEEELFRQVASRLEVLVRHLLRQNPKIGRWQQTGDLFSRLCMRLHSALQSTQINGRRHFFRIANLATRQILCDLARSYGAQFTFEGRHKTGPRPITKQTRSNLAEVDASDDGFQRSGSFGPLTSAIINEQQALLHTLVNQLENDEEREVIELVYYSGLSTLEAAALQEVDERTIRRRLRRAMVRLGELMHDYNS